ncbi:transcriptional regulator BetI [Thalassotalea euphylliae]|uniref:transcriptional regulator BetI n=1 Tax=Thalassotalea euphylliae TaxID=1655234 RepID=UPI003643DE2F
MPKVGMEKIRKQQLIEATLTSIEQNGLHGTTISSISKLAGVSTGIISHYFGGKPELLQSTFLYLLDQLKIDFLAQFDNGKPDARQRIDYIINANFSLSQISNKAAIAWLSFWVQSMHDENWQRLQKINNRRLAANLRFAFRQLLKPEYVEQAATMLASQIDGQWLRCALDHGNEQQFESAAMQCRELAASLVSQFGKETLV